MSYNPTLIFNTILVPAGDMSANITSPSYDVSQANTLAVQTIWAGTNPIGTTSLQASTDNLNFNTITDSTLSVSGNSGNNFYNVQTIGYRYIRVIYTFTSGTGSMQINISGKFN